MEAVQLAPSSYGLQLYKVLVVENKALREKLRKVSWDQSQITDASHVLVFCNYVTVNDGHVDTYLQQIAKTQQVSIDDLGGAGIFMKQKINEMTYAQQVQWTARQTYLALGNLLTACATMRIDACPMEGFEPEAYNELLGLTAQGLNAQVVAPIGYRAADDHTQHRAKVRKPIQQLFEVL
jgi:nitroreductase